jgi:hypothetical protein
MLFGKSWTFWINKSAPFQDQIVKQAIKQQEAGNKQRCAFNLLLSYNIPDINLSNS